MNNPKFNENQLAFLKKNFTKWDFTKPLSDNVCEEVLEELGHWISTEGFDEAADTTNAVGDMCESIVDSILAVYK